MFRLLLLLYPRHFRRTLGAEALADLRYEIAEARAAGGIRGVAAPALAVLAFAFHGLAERTSQLGSLPSLGEAREIFSHDVRFSIRTLRRTPLYTTLMVVTLGLGLGANTAIFSVVHAVLLTPLPWAEPDRLVAVWPGKLFSLELYDAATDGAPSLEGLSLYSGTVLTLTDETPTEHFGGAVTANHFDVLGVGAAMGRTFAVSDGLPGAQPVAVLSHELWTERFAGDPDILGKTIPLQSDADARRIVIGVMPPGYRALLDGAEAWIPIIEDRTSEDYANSSFAEAVGRLSDGAALETARTEVVGVARAIREAAPGRYTEADVRGANVVSLHDDVVGSLRTNLIALLGAVGIVLLIACANVANLLLSRGAARRREVGIRGALGAGGGRLFAQFTIESLVLGCAGGLVGISVAWVTRDLLVSALPYGFRIDEASLGPGVVGFAAAIALVSSLVFGLAPALGAARHRPAEAVASGGRHGPSRREARVQRWLASAELAFALIAVFSAGLLVRSVQEVMSVDPGFDAEGVLTFRVTAAPDAYPTDEDVARYFRDVEAAVASVPGVVSTGATGRLPLAGGVSRITIFPEGFEPDESGELPDATHRLVTSGYAETMGFTLVEGTFPEASEYAEGPLRAYVTEGLAERFWPDGAIGKHFIGRGGVPWFTVAGVISDVREDGLEGAVMPGVYLPHRDWPWRTMHFVVRTRGEPESARGAVEEGVWSVSPGVPLSRVSTLDQVILRAVESTRLTGRLFTLFGALALLLGAVGVYGVMSYALRLRRREFGIRLALGASRSDIVREAVAGGAPPLVLGIGMGVVGSFWVGRVLAASLEGIQPVGVEVLLITSLLLTVVAAAAVMLPVRGATEVEPAEPLRAE